jgi:DNA-directed RNA polymerase beta subunit
MPYRGNYEDAIVISESAAKRLASEHMNQVSYDLSGDKDVDKNKYVSIFPGKFTKRSDGRH